MEAPGGHVAACAKCGHPHVAYNSCKNRHCPKCQGPAARDWMAARAEDLLPVEYFHVVFTLPAKVARLAYANKKALYGLLFEAAAETVTTIAADPRHLGARIGMTSVLSTWGSAMAHHPHIHMIVPGGGLSHDGTRWVSCRPGSFLPVRVLSRLFRRLFVEELSGLHRAGKLAFFGELARLANPDAFTAWLAPLRKVEWVVYAKPPFGGPEAVLAYLGRYTHRVAVSNTRLVSADAQTVEFRWKDHRTKRGDRMKVMRLATGEFIRRFLIHVLPDGFHRIRSDGHRSGPAAHPQGAMPRLRRGDAHRRNLPARRATRDPCSAPKDRRMMTGPPIRPTSIRSEPSSRKQAGRVPTAFHGRNSPLVVSSRALHRGLPPPADRAEGTGDCLKTTHPASAANDAVPLSP